MPYQLCRVSGRKRGQFSRDQATLAKLRTRELGSFVAPFEQIGSGDPRSPMPLMLIGPLDRFSDLASLEDSGALVRRGVDLLPALRECFNYRHAIATANINKC